MTCDGNVPSSPPLSSLSSRSPNFDTAAVAAREAKSCVPENFKEQQRLVNGYLVVFVAVVAVDDDDEKKEEEKKGSGRWE